MLGFLVYLGLFIVLRGIYRFVRTLYKYDLLYSLNIYRRTSRIFDYTETRDGSVPWAFVANVGDDLGRAFVEELAYLGFNIFLHDALPHRIDELIIALRRKYPFRGFVGLDMPPTCPMNLESEELRESIRGVMQRVTLKVFVNVIALQPKADADKLAVLDAYSIREQLNDIDRCMTFPTLMLATLAPALKANAPSLILNVEAPEHPVAQIGPLDGPYMTYLRALTINLSREMKVLGKEVEVVDLKLGQFTRKKDMEEDAKCRSLFRPGVDTLVRSALMRVGCGETIMVPHTPHALLAWLTKLLPESVREWMRVKLLENRIRRNLKSE
ncbi:hypothetical protein F5Y10DRAFT_280349 [Nemania abortiva]|nr:hypothetical protein F5Y10DRAFT_280349 [Nemania abortiva]